MGRKSTHWAKPLTVPLVWGTPPADFVFTGNYAQGCYASNPPNLSFKPNGQVVCKLSLILPNVLNGGQYAPIYLIHLHALTLCLLRIVQEKQL